MWEQWKAECGSKIAAALTKTGIVATFDPENAFYNYIQLEYKEEVFHVGLSTIQTAAGATGLVSVFRSIDKVVKLSRDLSSHKDIFYSSITRDITAIFPSNRNSRSIAFRMVVEYLRTHGVRIVS